MTTQETILKAVKILRSDRVVTHLLQSKEVNRVQVLFSSIESSLNVKGNEESIQAKLVEIFNLIG